MEIDKELTYNFMEDGIITIETSNTYCKGIRLKKHSNVTDASLNSKSHGRSLFQTNQAQFLQKMLEYWYQRSVP